MAALPGFGAYGHGPAPDDPADLCAGGTPLASLAVAGSELRAAGLRECRWHGIVADDHVCVRPGEDASMATARAFGEIRDA